MVGILDKAVRLAGLKERCGIPSLPGVLMALWDIAERDAVNADDTQRILDEQGIGTTSAVREELRRAWT